MPELSKCQILCTTPALEHFQPEWKRLWEQDRNATPFQHPSWLLPWWYQFGQNDLRAVVVSHANAPIAFLPFYIYSKPQSDEQRLLLLGVGTTDYLDGLFAPDCRPEHVQSAIHSLQQESDWSVLHVSQLRSQSMLIQALRREPDAMPFLSARCSRMPALRIPELPVKIRRNAMYYRNCATRQGNLEFITSSSKSWPAIFDALVRLHTARWKGRGQPGVLADPRVLAWHLEAIPLLESAGLLRLCSLRLNGEDIAVAYSLADPASRPHRALYIYLTAYSPRHADLRPGTLLLGFASESAAEEGIETIDMLRGEEAYKEIWHAEPVPTHGFTLRRVAQQIDLLAA